MFFCFITHYPPLYSKHSHLKTLSISTFSSKHSQIIFHQNTFPSMQMDSGEQRIQINFRAGGSWMKVNNAWEYVTTTLKKRRAMITLMKYSKLVRYVGSKFKIPTSVDKIGLWYKDPDGGEPYQIGDDDDLSAFMCLAAGAEKPATIYVVVDSESSDVQGTSQTQHVQHNAYDNAYVGGTSQYSGQFETGYVPQFDDAYVPPCDTRFETAYFQTEQHTFVPETEEADSDENEDYVFNIGMNSDEEEEQQQPQSPEATTTSEATMTSGGSFGGINDYWGMPSPPRSPDVRMTSSQPEVDYERTSHVTEGQLFDTRNDLQQAISLKFFQENFQYRVKKSCRDRFEAVCFEDQCDWFIKARSVKKTEMYHVRKLVDRHTCERTKLYRSHRQANKRVLGHIIKEVISDPSRVYKGKDIVRDINERFRIDITYKQAWRGKCEALRLLRGSAKESFARLPIYFHNLELVNEGTMTKIVNDGDGRFKICFVALGCAIRTFLAHLRPLIIIDGAHLKGEYRGTMLTASGMDANNQIVPLAAGIAKSESGEAWTWFLANLKQLIGEIEGLVFISDRAASIRQAITTLFPCAHHGLCCRHLKMNVRERDTAVSNNKKLFWKACKAYRVEDFDLYMDSLHHTIPLGAQLMDRLGPTRWSRVHFPGMRYNVMTSNTAESINALTKASRKLPIVGLFEYWRNIQQEWYVVRHAKAEKLEHSLTPWAAKKINKRRKKSATWSVHQIRTNVYEVRDGRRNGIVDLQAGTCTCNQWQLSALPCGHVIAITKYHRISDCSAYASPYYKKDIYLATYSEGVNPVPAPQNWVVPDEYLIVEAPILEKKRVGRPSNCERFPSRGETQKPRKCSTCKESGHNRLNCPNPTSANMEQSRTSTTGRRQTRMADIDLNESPNFRFPTVDLNDF